MKKTRFVKRIYGIVLTAFLSGTVVISAMAADTADTHQQAKDAAAAYLRSSLAGQCPIPTYETEDPLISSASYTYENAITALAFMSEGDYESAAAVLDALTACMENDTELPDRFRNAYMAGKTSDLPGYWNDEAEAWIQDAYQVGTSTKSSCAAAVALLTYNSASTNDAYLNTALSAVDWVISECQDDTPGFTAGYTGWQTTDECTVFTYKSAVDNLWMYAACTMLEEATGWSKYADAADSALTFLTETMYSSGDSRFFQGTKDDGKTPLTSLITTDAQALAAIFLDDISGMDNIRKCLTKDGGYSYDNSSTDGFWLEGTAIAALALDRTGEEATAETALQAMEQQQLSSGTFPQASVPELKTGEKDRVLNNWPTTGACAWYILAANGYEFF